MSKTLPKSENKRAQVLISLLIAIALFAILARALFTLVSSSYSIISFTSARIAAKQLAQEKLESIRNLPYDDIGTVGGIPPGPIEPTENVVRNSLNYVVETDIQYVDDPFDDTAPDDLLPTDYKVVRVDVSWEGLASSSRNPVTFITHISPKGIETTTGGGTLSILVFNANAEPVGQADVHIVATEVDPQVDTTLQTSDNGRVILPGAEPCIECYEITVSKEGYSSHRTYSSSEVANPAKPHASVLEGDLTEISFAIDLTSDLTIKTFSGRDDEFTPLGPVTLDLRGDKIIGTGSQDEPVYKYQEQLATNSSGELELEELEWDNYYITLPDGSTLTYSGTNPLLPISLNPDTNITSNISLEQRAQHSLFLTFIDTSGTQISSVSATLADDTTYTASASSGTVSDPDFGQILFNDLSQTLYHLTATASGFIDHASDFNVSGNDSETIILNPE